MLTSHQKQILDFARSNGGTVKKSQVVERFGNWYYCNEAKHIGDCLSRMVRAKLLTRVRPGLYEIGTGTKIKPSSAAFIENQAELF